MLPAKTNPKNDLTKKDLEKIKSCVTSHNLVNLDLASIVHSALAQFWQIPITSSMLETYISDQAVPVNLMPCLDCRLLPQHNNVRTTTVVVVVVHTLRRILKKDCTCTVNRTSKCTVQMVTNPIKLKKKFCKKKDSKFIKKFLG